MNILLDKETKTLLGFSLKEKEEYENQEISDEEHKKFIELQSNGYSLLWNKVKNQVESVKLNQFEFINENGKIEKNIEAEKQYNNDTLLKLKREKIQLKKDIADFEEFEEDTAYLKEQLKEKETEIKELEEQLKKL